MPLDLPTGDAQSLLDYAPERYWALWQIPEGRYAYTIEENREAWLIVLDSEQAGLLYLLADARVNGRDPTQYRLDGLTLPDAFDAVRVQPLPFRSSQGVTVVAVLGVALVAAESFGGATVRHLPL